MENRYDLIVNPYAGRGRCIDEVKKVTSFLDAEKVTYFIHETKKRHHATEIAYDLTLKKVPVIVSCGGDGTIHEILNGIIKGKDELEKRGDTFSTRLALLPCGTGNDFMASLDLPVDSVECAKLILSGTPHKTDAINISGTYEICFACHGIDVDVVNLVNAGKKKTKFSYLKNILKCIFKGIKYDFDIVIDDNTNIKLCGVLASVLNARRVAGGLDFCPTATPNDGLFDIILIEKRAPIPTILHLLKVFGKGFVDGDFVKHYTAKKVIISSSQNTMDIDGELFNNKKFDAEIAPNIIEIIY